MLKKAALAGFGFVLAMNFSVPQAQAQVHVGVGVSVGTPVVHGAVVVQPAPVVVRPAPVVVVAPAAVVVYDDAFFVAHYWDYGFHDGWYYDQGTRYWVDKHHRRHYDFRYRDGRTSWERRRHDNGRHRGWYKGEDRGRGHRDDRYEADRRHDRGGRGHGRDRD
jgi:hypothetical protein